MSYGLVELNDDVPEVHLIKLRERLSGLDVSDCTIKRFYLAVDGDVEMTETKIRKDIKWRNVVKPLEIKFPSKEDPNAPPYVRESEAEIIENTLDHMGNPLLLVRTARHDGNLHDDMFEKFMIYLVERTLENSPKLSILFDLSGFGWKNFDYSLVKFAAEMFNDHYPERLASCLLLNPPSLFSYVFRLCKRFLGSRTIPRVHLIQNQAQLKEFVDTNKLPIDCSYTTMMDSSDDDNAFKEENENMTEGTVLA